MSAPNESIVTSALALPSAESSSTAPPTASNTTLVDASGAPSAVTTDKLTVTDADVADAGALRSQASEAVVTGLTPDQVMQELKENGYVDQLRRRMYDAFLANEKPSIGPTAVANPVQSTSGVSSSTIPVTAASTISASPADDSLPAPTLTQSIAAPPTIIPPHTNAHSSSLDIGTKPPFLAHLSALLSDHITSDHGNLRLLLPREQQNSLLNSLDSATVHHPHRNILGDATIYELLVKHVVTAASGEEEEEQGTGGMLDRDEGWVGKEANARVKEVIREMMVRSSAKEGDDDEGDEDEDEDEEDEDGEERQGADTATQPPHSSPLDPTQPSSSVSTTDMEQD